MPDSTVFEKVCDELERATSLGRLEVRGTVRLALKNAGLDARTVRGEEMAVVLKKLMPAELQSRGIADGERTCEGIVRSLAGVAPRTAEESPEEIFRRLGGGA
jgi:hypothetical protein